jgi:hypothetical protein
MTTGDPVSIFTALKVEMDTVLRRHDGIGSHRAGAKVC